jgi:predicted  nucleic acid-binding Zn-ribbon protein
MPFNPLQLRFIRFLGPGKTPADFPFKPGFNVLYGSSDTGKTFLVESIDFMLGAGENLRDIPERIGYDRILLGLTALGKDYTIQRSVNLGAFRLFDGLLDDVPKDTKLGRTLSAGHSAKNYNNLSHWLLQLVGLDNRQILFSKESGARKSLGFRALAHLCVIAYPRITSNKSPIFTGQWVDRTREYGVFRLLLTGEDDSAVTSETGHAVGPGPATERPPLRPDTLAQMISDYEDELAKLTDNPDGLSDESDDIEKQLAALQESISAMEGQISSTTAERREVYETYMRLKARLNEIIELQERFKLLNLQYNTDLKRLVAIRESGQFFVLREPMPCPLCGAPAESQRHDEACDGNVKAVAQAASAEIAKIKLLQGELLDTMGSLAREKVEIVGTISELQSNLKSFQQQIDAALSPDFSDARERYAQLIERRAAVTQAVNLQKRIKSLQRRLDEPIAPATKPELLTEEETPKVAQYIPKSALHDFSKTVEEILQEWHFPGATDVYFDEVAKDLVIGGRLRGSRGAGLCAITYSAFTLALFEYCRSRKMPHPGFVILDSPLIAYKEPMPDDEGVSSSDLKPRFYEHLESFAGPEQVFVIDNTDPPAEFEAKATHFTANEKLGRYGLFPPINKLPKR